MELTYITPIVVILCALTQAVTHKDVMASVNPRDLHLKVTTILVEPYVMVVKQPYNNTHGQYEGFIVDLLDRISSMLGLQYHLHPVHDGSYGYKKADGTWDGMVGEVISKEADLAAGPLYITKPRSSVVDFSTPFLHVQATLVQLRQTHTHKPVKSIHDLLQQSDIRFGTIKSGMLVRSFRNANHSFYRELWGRMRDFTPTVFMDTNELGIERVRASGGKYAYILPDTIGDYISRQSPCDLISTDKFLMDRHFGLAVQKGSGLLQQLNKALEILKNTGVMDELYDKWWHKRTECNGILSSKIIGVENKAVTVLTNTWLWTFVIFTKICLYIMKLD